MFHFLFFFKHWRKYKKKYFKKATAEVYMQMLVFEIKQKYEDIKFMMKDTWIKLISLENELGKLKCAKIPLICYGDKGEKLTFSNDQASVIDLMKHFGYNTQRPSWQSHLAAQPRVELDKPTLKKFGKNVIKCSQLTTKKPQPRTREQLKT